MGSKSSETKHFLKTFLCFLTSTFLLPKVYKETISNQCRKPRVPSGPKVLGREQESKILSWHHGTTELPNGLSMLTPCFKAGILITHSWSFSEELILYMVFFFIFQK